jgi:RimJ/RimL family protein N-acetyltransferase
VPSIPFLSEPLVDERAAVRDYAERDIPEILIAHQDDPQLHLRIGIDRPPSGAELGRLAEQEQGDRRVGRRAAFTILEPGSDVFRGRIVLTGIDWDNGRGELGIWLAPQARGKGLASAALRLLSRWLLRTCALERLQLTTESDNDPMFRVARAAGYAYEGVLRGYTLEHGKRVDNAVFSLLPGDVEG